MLKRGRTDYPWLGALGLSLALGLQASTAWGQTATDLICTGCVQGTDIQNGTIGPNKLIPGSINATTIANGSIGPNKLIPGSINQTTIATNAIRSNKILDGAVQSVDLADGAVTGAKIAAGTITADKLAFAISPGQSPIPISECGRINLPGSYEVVNDLPNIDPLNADGGCLIILSDDVTLDLGGFRLIGITGKDTGDINFGHGILMNGRTNVTIRNGTLRDFAGSGIAAKSSIITPTGDGFDRGHRIHNVRVIANRSFGIGLRGFDHEVMNSLALDNEGTGISVGTGSRVIDNTVTANRSGGIISENATFVTGNTAISNTVFGGIRTGDNSTIIGNLAVANGGVGIDPGAGSLVEANAASRNSGDNFAACADCTFGINHGL